MAEKKCDFCNEKAVYDTKTIMGPWAFTCERHFEIYSVKTPGLFSKLKEPTIKQCSHCGVQKPLTEFYTYTTSTGVVKYRSECKECNLLKKKIVRMHL